MQMAWFKPATEGSLRISGIHRTLPFSHCTNGRLVPLCKRVALKLARFPSRVSEPTLLQSSSNERIKLHKMTTKSTADGASVTSVASESALRSAGTLLSRVRAPHRRPGLTEGLGA
ncbi:hypothetical protein PoB_000762500 [Plakobranchus ocellatus]|uniref:Uncharacterized protein n=1 Tax=Plakobranchus ocellatus TaxID=259542 RepID=A0AAV3YEE6_9GAST|nr:hypothetical protein PoB_000762500 [Plakobranchus ocellatus]